jgi:diguanylate cyclase (GGDEF)-like protein
VTTADTQIGLVLDGRYELTEFIAAGGMGRVFKATQRALDRQIAVKLLPDISQGREDFQKRFFLEASLCARLSHPNIIRIFDYGCHDSSTYYIAMEYLEGCTLKQLLQRNGPLQPRRAIHILKQICSALIEAHGAGLVHRDLKPSNLFATPDPMGGEFVKILDFGVVKQLAVDMEFTHAGSTLGSPLFMSPEQIQDLDIDGRSDLYSLGVVLFQLLTGRVPFNASTPLQVVMKHLTEPVPSLAEANTNINPPQVLEDLVQRALKKTPDQRFSNAKEMLQALTAAEQALPPIEPIHDTATGTWNPDLVTGAELLDAPTGAWEPEPSPGEQGRQPVTLQPAPIATDMTEITVSIGPALNALAQADISGTVAYIDLNCPYCFALHERLTGWGIVDRIEWCMVEHASHILDGPFDLNQEQMLSSEVFEVHHRAPDIELMLPPQRCRSTVATRLSVYVERFAPAQVHSFRQALYRALWQEGLDIGAVNVLQGLLTAHSLPLSLLDECSEEPMELTSWQQEWDSADFDHSIPVLTHPASGRVLIGLPDERTLTEFLLGQRSRVVDSAVCYYQQQPSILICGWMRHMWPLLSDLRNCCEIVQAPTPARARELLSERAVPGLLIVEGGHVDPATMEHLAELARSRSVPWVVATQAPSSADEVGALSMGAVEYLPITDDSAVARARLGRILRDRYRLDRMATDARTDPLTQLPSRRTLLEELQTEWERAKRSDSPISLVLLNLRGFKAYNRAHGYLSGDQCLTELARLFERKVRRRSDLLARFSGNEFAVLLPDVDGTDARAFAEQLLGCVRGAGIENRSAESRVLTARIGVYTVIPTAELSLHSLVDGAHLDLMAQSA